MSEPITHKKYLIIEHGEYDSYSVDILEVGQTKLKDKEILLLLNCDTYSSYSIAGHINGIVTGWSCLDLLSKATEEINSMFCCYNNREYKTILDKKYTQDELLNIAINNDNSGLGYWERKVKNRYKTYTEVFDIYHKLLKEQSNV